MSEGVPYLEVERVEQVRHGEGGLLARLFSFLKPDLLNLPLMICHQNTYYTKRQRRHILHLPGCEPRETAVHYQSMQNEEVRGTIDDTFTACLLAQYLFMFHLLRRWLCVRRGGRADPRTVRRHKQEQRGGHKMRPARPRCRRPGLGQKPGTAAVHLPETLLCTGNSLAIIGSSMRRSTLVFKTSHGQ